MATPFARAIADLRKLPAETQWVEFKCNNADPQKIGEYISALANSAVLAGQSVGWLVWGIEDKTHNLVGTSFRISTAKKGNEDLENWLLRLLSPRIDLRVHEEEIDGVQVAALEIPRAPREPVSFSGVEYVRVNSHKKKLKEHREKERALWRAFDTTPFENLKAIEDATSDQVLELLDYPEAFRMLGIPLPDNRDGIFDRLKSEGLIASGSGGRWDILNLGAILFARQLDDFPRLGRKALRIIAYDGPGRLVTERERTIPGGYAVGFESAIEFLAALLPENEIVGQAFRQKVLMYPVLAIRELIPNALIHQDFSIPGAGPMIEVFDGRLEISNPGAPLVDPGRLLDMPPRSRNETLAGLMRRMSLCEERGQGIDKVVQQTESFQLPAPLFEAPGDNTRVTLYAHRTFRDMTPDERIRACYLHASLQYVASGGQAMRNETLRKRFGLEEKARSQVSHVIRDTRDAGFIRERESDSRSYLPHWA